MPNKESLAAKAGLLTFDVVDSINGVEVTYWRQIEPLLNKFKNISPLKLSIRSFDIDTKKQVKRDISISLLSLNDSTSLLQQLGIVRSDLFLLEIRSKSPADLVGLKKGDLVVKLNGHNVQTWQTVLDEVKSFSPEQEHLQMVILRDGSEKTFSVKPEQIDLPNESGATETRYAIGVVPAILSAQNSPYFQRTLNPLVALAGGVEQSWVWTKLISISLVRLVQNEVSARNIGGIITIGRVASKSFEVGLVAFLKMMAIISINLFLLNLLPVPVLDGGHLVFFSIEALKGTPLSFKKLEIAQQVGLVLLLSLMLFALFNDITHLISSW
ncbi:MAG: RIP metalloprotease RseP [Bdellovibrionales bacterium RBG_16_40_8]|nr:MAG: RIP metalloprotease RseP [Bdellovibrionales bacterium RBG_16_40_8]